MMLIFFIGLFIVALCTGHLFGAVYGFMFLGVGLMLAGMFIGAYNWVKS